MAEIRIRYVKGPLKGSFPEKKVFVAPKYVMSFGHQSGARFFLPIKEGVQRKHAVILNRGSLEEPQYVLQAREGSLSYRYGSHKMFTDLGASDLPLEHGLEFCIGPHQFKVVDPEQETFWEKPTSRRKFVTGLAVGGAVATGAAVAVKLRPAFWSWLDWFHSGSRGPSPSREPFSSRVAVGAYPIASWQESQGQDGRVNDGTIPVHFVPLEGLHRLQAQSGVQFKGNAVFVRLNQQSQSRFLHQGAVHFFSDGERRALHDMVNAGVRPHFVLEPTEGLYHVPRYQATLDALARDVFDLGPSTVQFAPGFNSPQSPYYWKKPWQVESKNGQTVGHSGIPPGVDPSIVLRDAFKAVHAAFKTKKSVSVVFSPLVPHDPQRFEQQSDEVAHLAQLVKPYVSGAGGLFFPDTMDSVAGLKKYAEVLKRQKVRFVGLDGFASRGEKPFEESLALFHESPISGEWKYVNFSDVPSTIVNQGGPAAHWNLTSEKQRMMKESLEKP